MKKLYYAQSMIDCLFVAEELDSDKKLTEQAKSWMEEEIGNSGIFNPVLMFEIKSFDEIPISWLDGIVYGQGDTDFTAKEWFEKRTEAISKKEKEEKELYLKLKQKYEP